MSSSNTPRSGKTADPTRKCEKAADKNGRAMRSSSRIALIRSICEEKPCKCSACSKAFISAACLSKHMQLHKAKGKCIFLLSKRFYSDHSLIFCCCLFSIAILKLISLDLKCFIGDVKFLKFSWKADIRDKFHGFIAYIQSRKEKMEILIFSLTFFYLFASEPKEANKLPKKIYICQVLFSSYS